MVKLLHFHLCCIFEGFIWTPEIQLLKSHENEKQTQLPESFSNKAFEIQKTIID